MVWFSTPFLFRSSSHTLLLSTTILSISSSLFSRIYFSAFLSPFVSCYFSQMPVPSSCLCHPLSLFLILHGFSPVIHPGQAPIPYKASGSPHLASYFHIRSAVTDRVYTGSSLECEAACPSAVPQSLLCSLLLGTKLVAPLPFSLLLLLLAALSPLTFISPHFSPFLLNSSSHHSLFSILFSLCFFPPPSVSQLHLPHLSVPSISNRLNTKHTQTRSHFSRLLAGS